MFVHIINPNAILILPYQHHKNGLYCFMAFCLQNVSEYLQRMEKNKIKYKEQITVHSPTQHNTIRY